MSTQNNDDHGKIGPLPVAGPAHAKEQERVEDVETPLQINMKNPRLHRLAKHVGWKRIFEIAKEEKQAIEEAKQL